MLAIAADSQISDAQDLRNLSATSGGMFSCYGVSQSTAECSYCHQQFSRSSTSA